MPGYWGTEAFRLGEVPKSWYQGWISTFLGFPPEDFFSGDYFSLVPWMFLYLSGYFLYDIVIEKKSFQKLMECENKAAGMDWQAQPADLSSASACCTAGAGSILVRERYVCLKDMGYRIR